MNTLPPPPARHPLPLIAFPEELPVSSKRDEISQAIAAHPVVIVCGETGSGKTTQLPKMCLELGRGTRGLIGHTQPRRVAASSTAARIAQELNSPLGEIVGFKVRFRDTVSPGAWVKLMTDGILLAETQHDPHLRQYDTLIIDEAHERSLNIDFLLGYLKQLTEQRTRTDLKVIITSATMDAARFAKHFTHNGQPAPIIEVSGRLYPVEIRYRPIDQQDLMEAIVDAAHELARGGPGDILVFLPGEREIREAAEALRKHHPPHIEILPLFARLSAQEQMRIFKPSGARRIILSTNVAETSLTVPGIRYVIDTGLARVKRYSYRNKVEQLQIEPIAQSAAKQRAGRCGRVAAGVCIRLYDEQDFQLRPAFTEPEILRSSLAGVILRMKSLHLGDIENFPFIEAPSGRAIADGMQLLQELGALEDTQLTPIGRQLAKLPVDPRAARMILAGKDHACLSEMLIIASALSVQDPRERPLEAQAAADLAHKKFAHDLSEFISMLTLWDWFDEALKHKKSNRLLQDHCRAHFLSQRCLREWREVHSQLTTLIKEQGWHTNDRASAPATYEQLHMALLTGLLGNIGCKSQEATHYLGTRGIKFFVAPSSSLVKKAGQWIMAAELVNTTRLYARCIAKIQPEWLEKVAKHCLKKSYGEPRWEKRSAQVTVAERATLYGLVVYSGKRMDFARINPKLAREIFIRDALVGGDFDTRAPFFAHNQQLIRDIEHLEHQSRRLDVLVDDALMIAFYDQRIPQEVTGGISFEKWHKHATAHNPTLLYLSRDELMRHEAAGITTDMFPKTMRVAGMDMGLSYHFEPSSPRDGVTLTCPLVALNQITAERCDWLVAGMLKDKVTALLKSLPQKLRRHCVPLPHYAAAFWDRVHEKNAFGQGKLIATLIADLREHAGVVVQTSDFKHETLAPHLFMNFKVIDDHGRQLDMGRNLAALQSSLGKHARERFQNLSGTNESRPITQWDFGDFGKLTELREIRHGDNTLIGFPALVDKTTHCTLDVFDDANEAARLHTLGLLRLCALQLAPSLKMIEKNIPNLQAMSLQFMRLGSQDALRTQIIAVALRRACLPSGAPLPHDQASFDHCVATGRTRLTLLCQEIARLVGTILAEYAPLPKKLQAMHAMPHVVADVERQLGQLITPRFIQDTEDAQLVHFPRYLKAIHLRLDKLRIRAMNLDRDAQLIAEWTSAATPWLRAQKERSFSHHAHNDMKMTEFRWLLEELRVALFAQELKTPMPVSVKRLLKVWEMMRQ